MPYHVYIQHRDKFGNKREAYFLDLSKEQLEEKVVNPYHTAQSLMPKGEPVDPLKIDEVMISETQEYSVKILPALIAEEKSRASQSAYGFMLDGDFLVVDCGTKVTGKFIKHPPTKETNA